MVSDRWTVVSEEKNWKKITLRRSERRVRRRKRMRGPDVACLDGGGGNRSGGHGGQDFSGSSGESGGGSTAAGVELERVVAFFSMLFHTW